MLKRPPALGLCIALSIIGLWATSLTLLLSQSCLPLWLLPLAVLWQSFLYTGLFITAHDAMHGVIYSASPKLNNSIGSLAVFLYGLFSYQELLQKHWLHHRFPASERDPDFHNGQHQQPLLWYLSFMARYWSWKQFWGVTILFNIYLFLLHISLQNLLLFWLIPCVLSSIQLFYFGTFLPHREPAGGFTSAARTRTLNFSTFWSFLACYHFGYHEEHHQCPNVPWWQLPTVHRSYFSANYVEVIQENAEATTPDNLSLVAGGLGNR
jgi:beta-carotene/zeaxanthin 4-ketolase